MADDVRVTNLPDSGSAERVAFDLMKMIAFQEGRRGEAARDEGRRDYLLDLYVECIHVTRHGFREGR